MHIIELAAIINEQNNKYHNTIKMKPADLNSSMYIDLAVETNNKDLKFEVGDYVRISKYKNA